MAASTGTAGKLTENAAAKSIIQRLERANTTQQQGGCTGGGGIEDRARPRGECAVRMEMIFQKLGHKGRREVKGRNWNGRDPEGGVHE